VELDFDFGFLDERVGKIEKPRLWSGMLDATSIPKTME
jgi:hypothetical protein